MNTYDELIIKIISWAEASFDIKALFLVGSRARVNHPADVYSDLDLVMVATNPDQFLSSTQWLKNIGDFWMSFIESTAIGGGEEIRVMFENALDVDFAIFSEKDFREVIVNNEFQGLFKRGYRVLIDRNGLAKTLSRITIKCQIHTPPSESEFLNFVNDFWYHSIWTMKKLQRGELWSAKSCVDIYMKQQLLGIIECHTHIIKGWDYDTWHNGRFLDIWAEQRVKDGLQNTFAHYNTTDVGCALLGTMDLFRSLATEVAVRMDFDYPNDADKNATDWIKESLSLLGV